MANSIETPAAGNAAPAEATKAETPLVVETKPVETPTPAPAAPATLLDEEQATTPEPEKAKAEAETAERAGAPEKYDFTPPEGVTYDPEALSKFEAVMRAADIPQEHATQILELGTQWQTAYQNAYAQALKERADAWRKEAEADPDIGGKNLKETVTAIRSYLQDDNILGKDGAKDLLKVLNETGLGNHKGLLKALSIGARLNSEDVAALSSGRDKPVKTIRSLYDKSTQLV